MKEYINRNNLAATYCTHCNFPTPALLSGKCACCGCPTDSKIIHSYIRL